MRKREKISPRTTNATPRSGNFEGGTDRSTGLAVISRDPRTIETVVGAAGREFQPVLVIDGLTEAALSVSPKMFIGLFFDTDSFASPKALRDGVGTVVRWIPDCFLILLAHSLSLAEEAEALSFGFDHCLRKPLDADLVAARLGSLTRRFGSRRAEEWSGQNRLRKILDLELDVPGYRVICRGELIPLTQAEFTLLEILSRTPGRTVCRETLGIALWGWDCDSYYDHIKCHMSRLRRKLSLVGSQVQILPIRGRGYCLA